MEELLEIINRIGSDDPPSDEELTDSRTKLVELLTVAAEGEERDLAAARELRTAIDTVDVEVKARADAAVAEEEEAKQLLEGITAQEEEGPDDDETEEPAPEEQGDEVEAKKEKELVGVGAAGNLANAVKRTSARVQRDAEVERESKYDVRIRAVGAAQGYPLGVESTMDDVAKMFARDATAVRSGRQSLMRVEKEYPVDRQLGKLAGPNNRIIDSIFAPDNLTVSAIGAAGGICGPLAADFSHPICGDRGRPIRDSLTQFQADRGGIRYAPSATLADVVGGTSIWTAANDVDPTPSPATKACLVIDCEDELEALVDAVVACVQIGNFQARFNPEFWRSRLDLLAIAHDRLAETTIYNEIVAQSTAVTYAATDGTVPTVLGAIDKAVQGLKSRLRITDTQFRAIMPEWLHGALRADLARQAYGSPSEQLAASDAVLDSYFSARGVTPTWSPDVDLFAAQAAGALQEWPGGNAVIVVYPVGTFMFLDGGTLDLGTEITDSTLNQTNDRQAFMETFEKVVKRGCESLAITVPVDEVCLCPAA